MCDVVGMYLCASRFNTKELLASFGVLIGSELSDIPVAEVFGDALDEGVSADFLNENFGFPLFTAALPVEVPFVSE